MDWQNVHYTLPLGALPRLQRIGIGVHGPNDGNTFDRWPGHWYVHLYSYRAEIIIDDQLFPILPGYAGLIPPQGRVTYRFYGRSTHLYAHFIPREGASTPVQIPAMQPMGARFIPLTDRFHEAVRMHRSQPERAEMRLLDILWELTEPAKEAGDSRIEKAPKTVREACYLIDQILDRRLTVPHIAMHVEVSPEHLSRLFRQHLGTTVVEYIRRHRVLRAKHLLEHSWLPIKEIARQVGIPNLQHFSKTIHRELGVSPKRIREKESE